jgi:flagellar motility protein MotE (MotC chaperone)
MSLKNMTMDELEPMAPDLDEDIPSFEVERRPSLLRRVVVKIRLLPMVIFFSTLMLTVRVGDIWDSVDGALKSNVTVSSSEALAQAQPGAVPTDPNAPPATDLMMGSDAAEPAIPEADRAAIAARMLADDPTLLTQTEIDLLQKLAERRVEIDARANELDSRHVLLAAAEARIDIKIQELKDLQTTIEALVKEYDKQQLQKLLSLVKIYENMKPKDAARILEELDMDTLLPVVERMKDRSLAPILAKMNSQRARDITVELKKMKTIPEPAVAGG